MLRKATSSCFGGIGPGSDSPGEGASHDKGVFTLFVSHGVLCAEWCAQRFEYPGTSLGEGPTTRIGKGRFYAADLGR